MALSEEQRRLLVLYHDYVRERGLTMCERVTGPDGVARHRQVRIGRGQDLILWFESWLEQAGGERTGTPAAREDGSGRA